MTALLADTKRDQLGGPNVPVPARLAYPVEANTQIFASALAFVDPAGNLVNAIAPGVVVPGVVVAGKNNLNTNAPYGAAGAQRGEVQVGCFPFATDGSFTAGAIFQNAYAVDNNTLSAYDGGGMRPYAGFTVQNPLLGTTAIYFQIGEANPYSGAFSPAGVLAARCVITALPGTYTGTTTGTLTASANGAIAAQNGVTPAAGDLVWLEEGATNIVAATDGGLMQVVAPGTGALPYILKRPAGLWETGAAIPVGATVKIGGEDTLFGGSTIHTYAVKGAVIDTTAPSGFPDRVSQQLTMAGTPGVKAFTNVPIRSATKSAIVCALVTQAGTSTGIVTYTAVAASTVAGHLGTATATVAGFLAANVENNVADASVVQVTVFN